MFQTLTRGKTMVFIDAGNMYHAQRRLGWRINFKKLKELLQQETEMVKIYYYTAYDPNNINQKKFVDFLEIVGYHVKKKPIKFIKDITTNGLGHHKGNLDIELTIDAIDNLPYYHSAILFSGDSDFEPLIKYLKSFHKQCLTVSTKGQVAIELIRQTKFIDIKKYKEILQL